MNEGTTAPSGVLGSLRAAGELLLADLHDRVALLALELEEEKFRLIRTLVWISAAMFAGAMALAFASLTLVYFFWDTARIAVLGGLAGFYTVLLVLIATWVRRLLARQARPFAATLAELEEDRRWIQRQR